MSPPRHFGKASWPRAAIFDFDGLLVQTASLWERAFVDTLTACGRALGSDNRPPLVGASVSQAAEALDVSPDDLRRQLAQTFRADCPDLLPGAREIVNRLRGVVPLAIATNAPLNIVERVLGDLRLSDCFDHVVSAESPPNREKPAPDVYVSACARLNVAPSDSVAFEDSPAGARAALRAGLVVVYVPADRQPRDDIDLCVEDLTDPRLLSFLGLDGVSPRHSELEVPRGA